jgi:hypothetical protein
MSYELWAMGYEEYRSKLIAQSSLLKAHCSKLIAQSSLLKAH